MVDLSIPNNLNTYYNKIHNIDIYSILKKRNVDISDSVRESLYNFIHDLSNNKSNFYTILHNMHNKYINDEIKIILCIFHNVLFFEINILDIILLFYHMDIHTLKNFIRFFNIQVIKSNKNIILEKPLECIEYRDIHIKKKDILGEINTYSNKNIVHTLLLINFVKKYYFPNLFIL